MDFFNGPTKFKPTLFKGQKVVGNTHNAEGQSKLYVSFSLCGRSALNPHVVLGSAEFSAIAGFLFILLAAFFTE